MSKLTEIVRDVAGENPTLREHIERMEGKTIKRVRLGARESIEGCHNSEVLHIEFMNGETLNIYTGSNAANPEFQNEGIKPEEFYADFMFEWKPEERKREKEASEALVRSRNRLPGATKDGGWKRG